MTSTLPILQWTPSTLPAKTVFSTVAITKTSSLASVLSNAVSKAMTETNRYSLMSYQLIERGAKASLTIASAGAVTATATSEEVLKDANEAIWSATIYLFNLSVENNQYKYDPSWAANIIYILLFGAAFVYTLGMLWKSRYHWYNVTFICGWGLEFIGFLGRCLAHNDTSNLSYYVMQYVCLTIAPAFLMGGIYFIFAQMVILHGRQFSVLKPMWYSYFFIASDVLSILVQCAGGGTSSLASSAHKDPGPGNHVMLAGLAIQVASMTVFICFYTEFLQRTYFRHYFEAKDIDPLNKRSFKNFFKLLFNAKSTRAYRDEVLDKFYNPKFADIRQRKLMAWYPLAIAVAVVLVYIRCIYRVVELSEGFNGWLMRREWPLMVLDSMMMGLVAIVLTPFHPVIVFGAQNRLKVAHIKSKSDVEGAFLSENSESFQKSAKDDDKTNSVTH